MLMILPPPCFFMILNASRVQRNGPLRLMATMYCQSSNEVSSIGPLWLTPALLTRMSSRPKRVTVCSNRLITSSSFVTSDWTAITVPPPASSSVFAFSRTSARRPEITTVQPSAMNASAIPRPMPVPPPVMIAILPSSLPMRRSPFSADLIWMNLDCARTGIPAPAAGEV